MSAPKIFFTGASGYVGGDVLYAVLEAHPDWESNITVLLRNRSYEPRFKAKYPDLNIFVAELDDTTAIAEEVAKNEIVLHFALSADHLPAAQAIVAGLEKRGGGIYIHTSGTDVLLDPRAPLHPTEAGVKVIDDWDGIAEVTSLHDDAPHRNVDKFVLSAGTSTLKTAIICPSTIYGTGRGVISQRTDQIPGLAKLILQRKRGVQFRDGETFWNSVHMYDLARLYVAFVDEALSPTGKRITWNEEGYYLVESGTYFWSDVTAAIVLTAYELGLLETMEVEEVDVENRDVLKGAGRPVVNYAVKASAIRARMLLGWTPVEGGLEEEIPEIVKAEARALGLQFTD
ncbi:NAD(P)-binding protein [Aspergillus crustosus]